MRGRCAALAESRAGRAAHFGAINLFAKASSRPYPSSAPAGEFPGDISHEGTAAGQVLPLFSPFSALFLLEILDFPPRGEARAGLLKTNSILGALSPNFHPAHPQLLPVRLYPSLKNPRKKMEKIPGEAEGNAPRGVSAPRCALRGLWGHRAPVGVTRQRPSSPLF